MKRIALIITILLPFAANAAQDKTPSIVPMPQSVEMTKGNCKFKGIIFNCDPALDARTIKMFTRFADQLTLVTTKTSSVATPVGLAKSVENEKITGLVAFLDNSVPAEGYTISIRPRIVEIHACDYNGFFYAVQTIKQMLPTAIYGKEAADGEKWSLPCCIIKDSPRFAYRGMHLDSCRHFWTVEEVKKYLDVMAIYKLNRFHWHITEDQGWRIEIKKYPKLTEVGAFREGTQIAKDRNSNDGIRYGGYYTQEQVKDIVAYADALGITVIPEVDLPGHMQAALTAYPELGCEASQPKPYKVWTRWGVSKQVLCVGKETTMKFLEDVVCEVADLFPSEYFHIGGDECPRDEWKVDPYCQAKIKELGLVSDENASAEARLQNYVTARIQKKLAEKGKKIIGWDEVLEGELAEGATVMSWRGSKGGIKAASMGYDVIMTPNNYCYFDHCQSTDLASEPLCISNSPDRAVTLEKVYGWDPYEGIAPEFQHHVLGPQANLWTEYIGTPEYLEYMLLPRLLALSEVQWCNVEVRDFSRFENSLTTHEYGILDLLGYNYRGKK